MNLTKNVEQENYDISIYIRSLPFRDSTPEVRDLLKGTETSNKIKGSRSSLHRASLLAKFAFSCKPRVFGFQLDKFLLYASIIDVVSESSLYARARFAITWSLCTSSLVSPALDAAFRAPAKIFSVSSTLGSSAELRHKYRIPIGQQHNSRNKPLFKCHTLYG
jgi:hypothetical protein